MEHKFSFFPRRFSLSYSSSQSFTRVEWKSCIKVFLSSLVGKPWVLKFGWISNTRYLICLRELYLSFQLKLSSLQYSLVWLCNAQIPCFLFCWLGQLRSQRVMRSVMKPNLHLMTWQKTNISVFQGQCPYFQLLNPVSCLPCYKFRMHITVHTSFVITEKICKCFLCNPSLLQQDLIFCSLGNNCVWKDMNWGWWCVGNTDRKHYQ